MNAKQNSLAQTEKEQPLMLGFFEKVFKTKTPNLIFNLNNPNGLRIYFTKIQELHNSGSVYPVNLNDVWPLVYGRKDEATRAIRCSNTFLKNIDYQVLRNNVENPKGGRPEEVYMLSVPCLEFFIARKRRQVFEVYRSVFHQVLKIHKKPGFPKKGGRNINRLTKERLVDIMADVVRIENTELRLSITKKLGL